MKISSQLANNFDYCSAEIGILLSKNSLLRVLGASAVSSFLNRYSENSHERICASRENFQQLQCVKHIKYSIVPNWFRSLCWS
jgi:hypothetical protein